MMKVGTEVSLALDSLHQYSDPASQLSLPFVRGLLLFLAHLSGWMCVYSVFTRGIHMLPAVQTCPTFPILQLCSTVGFAKVLHSS